MQSALFRQVPLLAAAVLFCASITHANVGQEYGFGSRSAALGGATVAWGFDGYAAYTNPAGLPLVARETGASPDSRLMLSWGLLVMDPEFTPIEGVLVENEYTSGTPTYGNVDNNYRSTLGQELGIIYQLFPDSYRFTFGLTTFLPLAQVAFMDTGETFVPEYPMYRSRTQRPQFELGVGGDLGKGFHVGVGLHLAFGLTSNATVFLQAVQGSPSTIRFSSSLKPKAAPYFGFLLSPEAAKYSLGAVIRLPVTSSNEMVLNSGARLFGGFASIDFDFTAVSALYYDPLAIELGGSWQHSSYGRFYAQVDYQFWSDFQSPALFLEQPSISECTPGSSSCGVKLSAGQNPAFNFVNILVPRVGEELDFGKWVLRVGYAYRPSFLGALPVDAGNYLDPPKHMLNAGLGFRFQHFLHFAVPWKLDLHASYQQLVSQHVTKTPNDEAGNSAYQKIGYPGYDAGGKIWGGGVSLTLAF